MSLVRDLVAALFANDDPLLGLFGAFAYDLVFQIEDLVQKRARESDQRDIVLYVPDRLLAYDRATGRGVVLSYDFSWKGKSTKGLPRDTAESVYAKTPRQGFADHAPGEYQATVEVARAAFARGDLFEAVPGQLFAEALRAFAGRSVPAALPHQPVALWRADESRRRRISGVGLAGNVRALRRPAGRDLPDLGHDRARRRCDRRCRADPAAA